MSPRPNARIETVELNEKIKLPQEAIIPNIVKVLRVPILSSMIPAGICAAA